MSDDSGGPDGFDYGDRLEDGQYENYPTIEGGEFEQKPRDTYVHEEGCGRKTTMTGDLPESVARDPTYYTDTFCAGCGEHVPVEEVRWEDGEPWVTGGPETVHCGAALGGFECHRPDGHDGKHAAAAHEADGHHGLQTVQWWSVKPNGDPVEDGGEPE